MKYTIGLSGKANAAQAERLANGYCYFHIKRGNRIVAQVEAVLDDLVACYDVDGKDLEFVYRIRVRRATVRNVSSRLFGGILKGNR